MDDRDQTLPDDTEIEVCVRKDLDRDCSDRLARDLPTSLPDFDSIRVEGPHHGPLQVILADLGRDDEGRLLMRVPRKAVLTLAGMEAKGSTLSLYEQTDRLFRKPLERLRQSFKEPVRVPAGAFVASLWQPDSAPQLVLLELAPGEERGLRFVPTAGWSLLLRTVASGEPLAEAEIQVEEAPGFAVRPGPRLIGETQGAGLVVFNGLAMPLAAVNARHRDFLETDLPAISSSPATFAFQEIELPRGGAYAARVRVDGEVPGSDGAECRLVRFERVSRTAQSPPRTISSSRTDEQGLCGSQALRPGNYALEIHLPGVDRGKSGPFPVTIRDGETTDVDALLERVVLKGTVSRGGEGIQGYVVSALDMSVQVPNASDEDSFNASTDNDGAYELELWKAATYSVVLLSAGKVPVDVEERYLDAGVHEMSFELGPAEVRGRVVDDQGLPVPEAVVHLTWDGYSHRRAVTDEDGAFSSALPKDQGTVELMAMALGHEESDPVGFEVAPGRIPPPVVLELRRRPEVRGQVVRNLGQPVSEALVLSYRTELQEPHLLSYTRADEVGRFTAPADGAGSTRLFISGPGCPLTAASVRPAASEAEPVWTPVPCAGSFANLDLTLLSSAGEPHSGLTFILRREGSFVPKEALVQHLLGMGVYPATDSSGRIFMPALEPGRYDVYLDDLTSPANILLGADIGFLTTVDLQPWATAAAEVTVDLNQ